ncbi:hypothetical protein DACRYDRAFT_21904 [Dacryopinax primogenitus]|uniref:Uncharacterized protein n=1 Tax=Dacryopinax primogenitus (strain DJM 731) TaxID=1858805 RepID=M5G070_DACPD|nr:uncharacterized protein DACRYDRAFT_21904 [Dacryopinax primogenitus]EJU02149.1 hypothetical protein DACRYDRAFT_21904 [Dacryopinax primogenitus]
MSSMVSIAFPAGAVNDSTSRAASVHQQWEKRHLTPHRSLRCDVLELNFYFGLRRERRKLCAVLRSYTLVFLDDMNMLMTCNTRGRRWTFSGN